MLASLPGEKKFENLKYNETQHGSSKAGLLPQIVGLTDPRWVCYTQIVGLTDPRWVCYTNYWVRQFPGGSVTLTSGSDSFQMGLLPRLVGLTIPRRSITLK